MSFTRQNPLRCGPTGPYQHGHAISIQYLINIPHDPHDHCCAKAIKVTLCEEKLASPLVSLGRRVVLKGLAASILAGCVVERNQASGLEEVALGLQNLEVNARERLGAFILDTQSGSGFGYRERERFAHCSSFKLSLAAMVLKMGEDGSIDLSERLRWAQSDMLPVSPVTHANIERGLTIEELAHATLVTSDNTAANVLLRRLGGPARLTGFWAMLGDSVSRLDRYEPDLNETPPGTELDTTTPKAMALTTAALVQGNALTPPNILKLRTWMTEVQTGSQRIRAGFPPEWQSGDKTGTGISKSKHTYVDIAFGIPPGRAPIIATAYFEPANLAEPMDPISLRVLAEVGRHAARIIEIPAPTAALFGAPLLALTCSELS